MRLLVVLWSVILVSVANADSAVPWSGPAIRTLLPPNHLHLRRSFAPANVNEAQFNQIVDQVIQLWQPYAKARRLTILASKKWDNETVNAGTFRNGDYIIVNVSGGLARAPEQTADGFALAICHELGHGFGGYPFAGGGGWYSNEGEADYFASFVCAKKLWGLETAGNLRFRSLARTPAPVQAECSAAWPGNAVAQGWCARVAAAGYALANLFHATEANRSAPRFETPDPSVVNVTFDEHPATQCRLDTYLAGAVCGKSWDVNVVPGLMAPTPLAAEAEAAKYSCFSRDGRGARPRCWFRPLGQP